LEKEREIMQVFVAMEFCNIEVAAMSFFVIKYIENTKVALI